MRKRGHSSPLTAETFRGNRPRSAGDLSIESHGIAPIPEDQRYGSARRLFTLWFAPQVNMTGVFTGTLAIVLGLGFWLGLLAMVIGSTLGALIVAYLSTWGPRTGTAQLPNSRMAFGDGVALPAVLQWLSSIAWDALAGLFGGEALSVLLGIPFWVAVLIVLAVQGVVGVIGYELINWVQAVLSAVLFATFALFAMKLVLEHNIVTPASISGADLVGGFVLEVTIAFSFGLSWATYAADYSRYLPADVAPARSFGCTLAGLLSAYVFVQGVGIAAGNVVADQTVEGIRSVMGGGVLGAVALVVIAIAAAGGGLLADYSGSLALQTVGVRVRRPVASVIITILAFTLILWLHAAHTASRFQNAVLLVSYWIPAFVAVVVIDWLIRTRGRATVNPAEEVTDRRDAAAAVVAFVLAYAAAIPFMNTSLIEGPVAKAWHGADIAYFVNLLVAALLYGGYRLLHIRRST